MAEYILQTDSIAAKLVEAWEARDNDAARRAVEELEAHKKANKALAKDLARYEADAAEPEPAIPDSSREAKPVKRSGRPRKTTK